MPLQLIGIINKVLCYDLEEAAAEIINDNPTPLNQSVREQLIAGTDGNGKKLKKYKSAAYARKKHRMNSKPGLGTPDAKLSGETHAGVFNVAEGSDVMNGSITPHAQYLYALYGGDLFGVNEDNKAKYRREVIAPKVVEDLKNLFKP